MPRPGWSRRATELKALKARVRELEAEAPPGERNPPVEAPPVEAGDSRGRAARRRPDLGVVARELTRAAQGA